MGKQVTAEIKVQVVGGQAGNAPFSAGIRRTRQPLIPVQAAKAISGRVALGAMAQGFDQVAPALLLRIEITVHHPPWFKVEKLPAAQASPDVEGEPDLMRAAFLRGGRQGAEECVQRHDILRRHVRIGRVREGRVIVLTGRPGSVDQGIRQFQRRP